MVECMKVKSRSVLVIILLTSEQLQMKHQLVLIAVGHQPHRKEHIVIDARPTLLPYLSGHIVLR